MQQDITVKTMKKQMAAWLGVKLYERATCTFPSWIGVRHGFKRHTGRNPGVFSVMMNEDYYGLAAELYTCLRGGNWTRHPMWYAGHRDGYSVWLAVPATSFPAGENLAFYFRGFDVWNNELFDGAEDQPHEVLLGASVLAQHVPQTVIQLPDLGADLLKASAV